ncbi:MAG: hypothetical protein V3R86_04350 [Candidatus Hydrothermarchaeaceae archaeon]
MAERSLAFITKATDDWEQSEASRSALGAMLRGHTPSVFVIDADINIDYGDVRENFEWVVDNGGVVASNNKENEPKDEKISHMSIEDIAKKILESDFIVPF